MIYDDKFAYSHHATDPACGKLLNAFDLVRIHKFGDEDEKKSFSAMMDFAVRDERVSALLLQEKQAAASAEFEDWAKALQRDRGGVLQNSLHNITLIMENDEMLKAICFNQLADGMEIKGDVPWQHPSRFWRDADDAQLICCGRELRNLFCEEEDYETKYAALAARYETAKGKCESMNEKILQRKLKANRIETFSKTMKTSDLITEFDEGLWNATVDTMMVYSKKKIVLKLKDGTGIKWHI